MAFYPLHVFMVPSNSHLMICFYCHWTGHWNQKTKSNDQICACRLDWESHKISCTDFPNWQDCLSNCNFMPTRFQTRSLGDCHQNLWSTEHWLWIKKVRLYVQFKSQWDYCKLSRIEKREKNPFHSNNSFQLRTILRDFFYACQFETPSSCLSFYQIPLKWLCFGCWL